LYSLYRWHDEPPFPKPEHRIPPEIRIKEELNFNNRKPSYTCIYLTDESNAVQEWREQVRERMTARISAFRLLPTGSSGFSSHSSSSIRPLSDQTHHNEHRVLLITELLCLILEFAGPESQVKALAVSLLWRSSALAVVGSQKNMYRFRSPSGHVPTIEYSQVIASHMRPPRPTCDEQEKFGRHMDIMMRQRRSLVIERIIYPLAQYTQLPELPPEMRDRLFLLGIAQTQFSGNALASKPIADHWLDLSQVEMNPCFGLLGI
jgi:hypothetical protein